MDRFIVISGCSGGGKSTLLEELRRRGYMTVEEPGRRIVAQERATGGNRLPWTDLAAFARAAIEMAIADHETARKLPGLVFFDRGVIDALVAHGHATGTRPDEEIARRYRYNREAFFTPPWPEIYGQDAERRHDLPAAREEYDRLRQAYPQLGYQTTVLARTGIGERADFILRALAAPPRNEDGPCG